MVESGTPNGVEQGVPGCSLRARDAGYLPAPSNCSSAPAGGHGSEVQNTTESKGLPLEWAG